MINTDSTHPAPAAEGSEEGAIVLEWTVTSQKDSAIHDRGNCELCDQLEAAARAERDQLRQILQSFEGK